MSIEEDALKNTFENWAIKIQTNFIESPLFQPIGLELSCTALFFETRSDYSLDFNSEISDEMYPPAYYRPSTNSIHIFIEHKCFRIRESEIEKYAFLMFLLFHEANHKLLFHEKRGKEKDSLIWNIATDMEIHNTFYVYCEVMKANEIHQMSNIWFNANNFIIPFLFEKNDPVKNEGLFEMEYLQNIAEEIYNDLERSKVEEVKTFSINASNDEEQGGSAKVTVSTYTSKSGKKFTTTNIEFSDDEDGLTEEEKQDRENSALTRKAIMENTLQKQYEENVRSKGDENSPCDIFLKKLFHVTIDWRKILKSSLATALDKSEYFTWAKPRTSLFALPGSLYLPAQCEDENTYGTLIIARDESGSMTNEECQKAASIILEAKEFYKKIVVLKHDTKIVSINEIEDITDDVKNMLLTRKTAGGTSHVDVFQYIRDYSKTHDDDRISCCIFISDLYSDIEESQNIINDTIPRIYLCPKACMNQDHSRIKGKIIGIE